MDSTAMAHATLHPQYKREFTNLLCVDGKEVFTYNQFASTCLHNPIYTFQRFTAESPTLCAEVIWKLVIHLEKEWACIIE